jgi:hypothetical protein
MSTNKSLYEFMTLDQGLSNWEAGIDSSFTYSRGNLHHHLMNKQHALYSLAFCIFYQCRLVLHSSLVPQISGLPAENGMSDDFVVKCARVALQSAQSISQLGSDLIDLRCNLLHMGPFVGYCMYASACIQVQFVLSSNTKVASRAQADLLSSLKILETIEIY